MGKNSDNARIYGGDNDGIWLAPVGTSTAGITIDTDLSTLPAWEEVGWLESDTGVSEAATGSVEKIRGHQGNRVVRTRTTDAGTTYAFVALEDKAQTNELRYDIKSSESASGVLTTVRTPGQRVSRRAAILDFYDSDNDEIKERLVIDVLEVAPNGARERTNSSISGFPFIGEAISDIKSMKTDLETP